MNPLKNFIYGSVIFITLQICSCSLPSDVEPVRWKMNMGMPITNERFYARDLLPEDIASGLELRFGKTDTSGDTVTLVKTDSLKYLIEKLLVSADTSIVEEKMGARTLDNTPFVDAFFGLMKNNSNIPVPETMLTSQLVLSDSCDKPLKGIISVTLDETSPDLDIKISNSSKKADIKNVHVTLLDNKDTIGVVYSANIPALDSKVIPLPIKGKTIHNPITIMINVVVDSGTLINMTDGFSVSFSLDGQMTSGAEVVDSMIEYSNVFTGKLGIADSIDLDAIDLDDALLRCEMTNPSSLKMYFSGVIGDAWKIDFAQLHNLQKIDQLSTINDSSGFAGKIISDTLFKSTSSTSQTTIAHLSNMRLFPSWDNDSGRSVLNYCYTVRALCDGRIIKFKKDELFTFKLIPDRFPFIQIKGRFVEPSVQSFSSKQKIGFDWKESIIDSLRKSFRFKSAQMRLDLVPDLPPNSSMDSLLLHISLNEQRKHDSVIVNEKIFGVYPDSLHSITANLTSILNNWPDSIGFDAKLVLPSGTNLNLYNEKDKNGNYKSILSIGVTVKYTISIQLSWRALDTIRTELEQSSFSFDEKDLEKVNKLEEPKIHVELNALNNTNLNLTLYAIGAAKKYKDELASFSDSLIGTKKMDLATGDNLFSLFGNSGISLGARGKQSSAIVQIDKRGIGALLSGNKCFIRWFLMIPAGNFDAFTSKDYLDLKAVAVIEGIGNTDSLLFEDK